MAPCIKEFIKLQTDEAEKTAAVSSARARKASAEEICGLLDPPVVVETKMIEFFYENDVSCNIPSDTLTILNNTRPRHQRRARMSVSRLALQPNRLSLTSHHKMERQQRRHLKVVAIGGMSRVPMD
jgi:hypothetical protein